jgi:Ca2+-binding EF-hand superfamily protein
MRSSGLLLTVVLLAAAESSVCAQTRADPAELLAKADTDHDGRVSHDEFVAARAARFDKFDRNHDGFIDTADIPRFLRANADRMQKFQAVLNAADTDHDGRVSRDEYMAAGTRLFGLIDTNHDGYIDQNELQQASQRMHDLADR